MNNDERELKPVKRAARTAESFVEAALAFEQSKQNNLKRWVKVAWGVAGGSWVIALFCVACLLVVLLTHKDPDVVLVRVNEVTGDATAMRSVKDAPEKFDEVVDKAWLSRYVEAREAYDWYEISTQVQTVKLMSEDNVFKEYDASVKDAMSPLNILKDKGRIKAHVTGVSFVGDVAQIRVTTQRLNASGENVDNSPPQNWIITCAYTYNPAMKMTDQERLINPLGFRAQSYRKDAEALK